MSLLNDLRRITGENELFEVEQDSKMGMEQVEVEIKRPPIPIRTASKRSLMATYQIVRLF